MSGIYKSDYNELHFPNSWDLNISIINYIKSEWYNISCDLFEITLKGFQVLI